MNQQSENLLVWSCPRDGHEHDTWEEAELCNELLTSVERLEKSALQLLVSALSFLTNIRQSLPAVAPKVENARVEIYQRLRKKYEAAGEPYGQNDESMWRWLQEAISR